MGAPFLLEKKKPKKKQEATVDKKMDSYDKGMGKGKMTPMKESASSNMDKMEEIHKKMESMKMGSDMGKM